MTEREWNTVCGRKVGKQNEGGREVEQETKKKNELDSEVDMKRVREREEGRAGPAADC